MKARPKIEDYYQSGLPNTATDYTKALEQWAEEAEGVLQRRENYIIKQDKQIDEMNGSLGFAENENDKFEQQIKELKEGENMRYLITTKETYSPFLTKWFEPENHFNADLDMIVYDLVENKYTTDGKKWHEIDVDYL